MLMILNEKVRKFQDKQHGLNSISDRLKKIKDSSFLPSVADKIVFCIEISGEKHILAS